MARTYLLFYLQGRSELADRYLRLFCRLSDTPRQYVQQWMPIVAASQSVKGKPEELELLYFLASHPNQVFTREQLLDHIWGYEYAGDTRTVDVHIKRLREKIKDSGSWAISTVWGVGYKFDLRRN